MPGGSRPRAVRNIEPIPKMFSIRQVAPALLVLCTAAAVPARAQAPMEIVVNIPAGRLDVLQGGERIRSYPVSVGLPRHATPTGQAGIQRMVWNPSWTPPDSEWARRERVTPPGATAARPR